MNDFIISNIEPIVEEALNYKDLTKNDDCVKNTKDYSIALFIGFEKGQLFGLIFENTFKDQIERLFSKAYKAIVEIKQSYGRDQEAKDTLHEIENELKPFFEISPVLELGAFKTFTCGLELPMFYNF
jgi:hypothetical protein